MGTRHLQIVIDKKGEKKISQYGQWDGNPGRQGIDILTFLKSARLEVYQNNLSKVNEITDKQAKEVDETPNWTEYYPYLSRDCGSNIHWLILKGEVPYVSLTDMEEAERWCEGFYTINFQKNEFTSEFHGVNKTYQLDKLPTEKRYLKDMKAE